jgi:hypothetical protein
LERSKAVAAKAGKREGVVSFRNFRKGGEDHYWIMISAQNGTVSEGLFFRKSKRKDGQWAYRMSVDKTVTLTEAQGEIPKGADLSVTLINTQWNDEPQAH